MTKSIKIILGEYHNDPIIGKILCDLLPELVQLGYKHYLEETIKENSLQTEIANIDTWENFFQTMIPVFKRHSLDIGSDDDWDKIFKRQVILKDENGLPIQYEHLYADLSNLYVYALRRDARQSYRAFLALLVASNLSFIGIDADVAYLKPGVSFIMSDTDNPTREESMTKHILNANHCISHMGMAHLSGIQTKLLHKISQKKLHEQYIFIGVCSLQDKMNEANKYIADCPAPAVFINAAEHSVSECVKMILSEIHAKLNACSSKNENAHQKLSFLKQFTNLLNHHDHAPPRP